MFLCSAADVRAYFSPVTLTDSDILAIIGVATTNVLTRAGATDQTDANLIQAGIHQSVAMTLKRARTGGELAAGVETPEYKQQNTGLIEEIKGHEAEAEMWIQKYIASASANDFHIPSGRMGYGVVNRELS